MEVLLLQDIPGIGKKDDLLLVGDGYALNCLLPHRQALIATPTVRRRYAEQIRRRAEEKQVELKLEESKSSSLAGKVVTFEKKVTKTGKLYAAITEKHIVEAIKNQLSIDVASAAIKIPDQIKAVGDFAVNISIGENEEEMKVTVSEEK